MGIVGAVLGASLGLGPLGCGTSASTASCDGGACASGGSSSSASRGSSSSHGTGSSTGSSTASSGSTTSSSGSSTVSSGSSTASSGSRSSSSSSSSASSGPAYLPCESPSPIEVDGMSTGYVQCAGNVTHRPSVANCPSALPVDGGGACPISFGDAGMPGACKDDKDCTAHPLGTCSAPGGGGLPVACFCNYGCTKDSDCANGQICLCGDPVGSCVNASCTSDSACPTGSLCASNASPPDTCPASVGFSCQATADKCFSSAQCQNSEACVEETTDAGVSRQCVTESCPG